MFNSSGVDAVDHYSADSGSDYGFTFYIFTIFIYRF